MIKIGDIIEAMEEWAPPSLAESWDNVGLMTGDPDATVNRVILTLDVSGDTLDSAAGTAGTMILAHHPVIFTPLKHLTGTSRPVRIVRAAVRRDIAIYAAHTNLDRAPGGVSAALASQLGLTKTNPLVRDCASMKLVVFVPPEYTGRVREAVSAAGAGVIGNYTQCSFTASGTGTYLPSAEANPFAGSPGELSREPEERLEMIVPAHLTGKAVSAARDVHPYEEMACDLIPLANKDLSTGYGAIGDLSSPLDRMEFLTLVAERLELSGVRASQGTGDPIRRVAVLGGSGRSFIAAAMDAGADAYVTGDLGHHDYIDHGDKLLLVDATHRGTELPVLAAVEARLRAKFGDVPVVCETGTTAFEYIGH